MPLGKPGDSGKLERPKAAQQSTTCGGFLDFHGDVPVAMQRIGFDEAARQQDAADALAVQRHPVTTQDRAHAVSRAPDRQRDEDRSEARNATNVGVE